MYLSVIIDSLPYFEILATVLTSLFAFLVWVYKRHKSFSMWRATRRAAKVAYEARVDAINGLPSHFAALTESVRGLAANSAEIHEQLRAQTAVMACQGELLAGISAMVHSEMELDITPRFVCDDKGSNRFVNTAYARLLGVGRDELLGYGYQRFIAPENTQYIEDFNRAAAQHRSFESQLTLIRSDGSRATVRVRIVPHPESHPPATFWSGVVLDLVEHPEG